MHIHNICMYIAHIVHRYRKIACLNSSVIVDNVMVTTREENESFRHRSVQDIFKSQEGGKRRLEFLRGVNLYKVE